MCFYVLKLLYCYFYSLMIDLIEVEKERLLDEVSFLWVLFYFMSVDRAPAATATWWSENLTSAHRRWGLRPSSNSKVKRSQHLPDTRNSWGSKHTPTLFQTGTLSFGVRAESGRNSPITGILKIVGVHSRAGTVQLMRNCPMKDTHRYSVNWQQQTYFKQDIAIRIKRIKKEVCGGF